MLCVAMERSITGEDTSLCSSTIKEFDDDFAESPLQY
jgi:hypothetical protein